MGGSYVQTRLKPALGGTLKSEAARPPESLGSSLPGLGAHRPETRRWAQAAGLQGAGPPGELAPLYGRPQPPRSCTAQRPPGRPAPFSVAQNFPEIIQLPERPGRSQTPELGAPFSGRGLSVRSLQAARKHSGVLFCSGPGLSRAELHNKPFKHFSTNPPTYCGPHIKKCYSL